MQSCNFFVPYQRISTAFSCWEKKNKKYANKNNPIENALADIETDPLPTVKRERITRRPYCSALKTS